RAGGGGAAAVGGDGEGALGGQVGRGVGEHVEALDGVGVGATRRDGGGVGADGDVVQRRRGDVQGGVVGLVDRVGVGGGDGVVAGYVARAGGGGAAAVGGDGEGALGGHVAPGVVEHVEALDGVGLGATRREIGRASCRGRVVH